MGCDLGSFKNFGYRSCLSISSCSFYKRLSEKIAQTTYFSFDHILFQFYSITVLLGRPSCGVFFLLASFHFYLQRIRFFSLSADPYIITNTKTYNRKWQDVFYPPIPQAENIADFSQTSESALAQTGWTVIFPEIVYNDVARWWFSEQP